MDLTSHLHERSLAALSSLTHEHRRDTYVVSFLLGEEDGDGRRLTMTVGTNTEARVALALKATPASEGRRARRVDGMGVPSSADEARWNFAFWLQDELVVCCDRDVDPVGADLRDAWVRDAGWWYDDWEAPEADRLCLAIGLVFNERCATVARRLHGDGDVERLFGRPVPIVVHEVEHDHHLVERNLAANPPTSIRPYLDWIEAL